MIIKLSENWDLAFEKAVSILENGGIIVYPTDTLYGIGGNALAEDVVAKIYAIKQRDREKAVSVAVSDLQMLMTFFEINEKQLSYIVRYLPGPYTFLLKPRIAMPVSKDLVGVRVPNNFFIRKVIKKVGFPIVSTSANISGRDPPSRIEELSEEIKKAVDLIIDGGETMYASPSTVVDLVNMKIVRKGIGDFSF